MNDKNYYELITDPSCLLPSLVTTEIDYQEITIDCDFNEVNFFDLIGIAFSKVVGGGLLILKNINITSTEKSYILDVVPQLGLQLINAADYSLYFKKNIDAKHLDCRVSSSINRTGQCLALFRDVFGHDMSRDFWNWKYSKSNNYCIALLNKNTVKGYYGCSARTLLVYGSEVEAFQPCDVMIKKDSRGGIANGAFSFLVSLYLAQFRKQKTYLFGFPHKRQFILAKRLGSYSEVDEIISIVVRPHKNLDLPIIKFYEYSSEFHEDSWRGMKLSTKEYITLKKDAAYISQRYINHPCHNYICVCVLIGEKNVTLIFNRVAEDAFHLMDCIGDISNYHLMILAAVSYLENTFPGSTLLFWMLQTNYRSLLKDIVFEIKTDGARLVSSPWETTDYYRGDNCRWILSMGDSEFL